MALPLRHELKYFIARPQYEVLSRTLKGALKLDANADGLEKTGSGLIRDVYREMRTRLLHPVVIVDYRREAFLHPAEEVRITFDTMLRTGMNSIDLFNPDVPTIPVLDGEENIILEVKYNRVLPPYIASLLSFACPEAVQTAISKYTLCRRYEEKE